MAVASPPNFFPPSRSWAGGPQGLSPAAVHPDEVRGLLAQRKKTVLPRSNSSSSISSASSTSSATTIGTHNAPVGSTPPLFGGTELQNWSSSPRIRAQQQKSSNWPGKPDDPQRPNGPRGAGTPVVGQVPMNQQNQNVAGPQNHHHQQQQLQQQQQQQQQQQSPQAMMRPGNDANAAPPQGPPVLYLLSMNGSFDRKTIVVPFGPECVKIGRQTNAKTAPMAFNGYFDSKVLSRQHAEVHADKQTGKIYIRDVKSSNGTFVNGVRLSPENRESEPHELMTGDHLELGIDIINEDHKSIIHHKVSAKVEHAGWPLPPSSVLDMSFGDLDPANGAMIIPGGLQYRNRAASNASTTAGRMVAAGAQSVQLAGDPGAQRQMWMTQVTTEYIVKRLHNELRGARLAQQELGRTSHVIDALGGNRHEVKDIARNKPDDELDGVPIFTAQSLHDLVTGAVPSRADVRTRFSEPPAPPPSQPLPEKPGVSGPKRSGAEKPKPSNSSPPPPPQPPSQDKDKDSEGQIVLLTEALSAARKDVDSQLAKVRELEIMLIKERSARALAETMTKKLEESAILRAEGTGAAQAVSATPESPTKAEASEEDASSPVSVLVATLQSRIDTMSLEFCNLKSEMESWKKRSERAEAERDATAKTLAEMVAQVKRDDEARKAAEERRAHSRSRKRSRSGGKKPAAEDDLEKKKQKTKEGGEGEDEARHRDKKEGVGAGEGEGADQSTQSQSGSTLALAPGQLDRRNAPPSKLLAASIPYIAMVGVVAVGVSLMAYLNSGWQPPPKPTQ